MLIKLTKEQFLQQLKVLPSARICNQAFSHNEVWLVLACPELNAVLPARVFHQSGGPFVDPSFEWCMARHQRQCHPEIPWQWPANSIKCGMSAAMLMKRVAQRIRETKPQNYFWLIWQIMLDSDFYWVNSTRAGELGGPLNPHKGHAPENPIQSNRIESDPTT